MWYQLARGWLYRLVCAILILVTPVVMMTGGVLANELQPDPLAYGQPAVSAGAVEESAPLAQDGSPTTRTDVTGRYRFEGLPRGTHKVTLDPNSLPRAWRPLPGESVPTVWVVPGQEQTSDALNSGVRFTVVYDRESGAIAGRVFVDKNGDGLVGLGEAGLAGVTVIDPTIHQYFVPFDDRDLIALFRASNVCQGYQGRYPVGNMLTSGVSIVASWDGTVWYYDHWEDGYDPDPLRPDPSSTTTSGTLNAGDYQPFLNDVDTSRVDWGLPPYYYDGRDRITIVGEEAAVIRYAYPSLADTIIGSMLAGAWEIEETANWDTAYVVPAGEEQGAQSDFAFTGGSVMALQDNTGVYLDGVLRGTLGRGQTLFVNGAGDGLGLGGLDSGATFTATGPIMVDLYGSLCDLSGVVGGGPWSGNGYMLEPVAHWGSDYWSPVPSRFSCKQAETDIFLYNGNPVTITVRVDDGIPAPDLLLPPGISSSVQDLLGRRLAENRGVHIYAPGGEPFWGVGSVDSGGTRFEWGFSLVHDPASQALLGWSPGNATVPPSAYTPNPNGNVAWVTAISDTVVYVDLNGGVGPDQIDCNGDGDALDVGVDGVCNEPTSNLGIPLTRGQVLRVADPVDEDLSGARIYTRSYYENIVVSWGEDSCVSVQGLPYLDLGYTVLPLTSHSLEITKTAEPSPVRAGDVLTYSLAWSVLGFSPAPDLTISDTVPVSTTFITATRPVTVNGVLLTWPLGDRLPGDSGTVTFTVRVDSSIVSGTLLRNVTVITDGTGITNTDTITTPVVGTPALELTKSVTQGEIVQGMPFTYTIRITNTGSITLSPLVLTDTLPPGIHYVGPAVPQLPDWVAEPLLQWTFPGPFMPGASLNVAFAVTATPGLTGTLVNSATVTGNHPTGVVTDTDTVPVVFHDPEIALDKQLVSRDRDDVAPNYVTFTIAIANVGPSVIDVLPLQDEYDPYYLSFVRATPHPDEPADDGILNWYDLTLPGNGFGRNLGLGEVFTVTTVFSIAHTIPSTYTTDNRAQVTGAIDIYRNPANRPRDQVPISNVPTAVELLYFRGEGATDRQVRLEWATALELDNVGFRVYRADEDDRSRASLVHFEPAAVMGARLGATYAYTDTVPADGVWWYWLVDVDTHGVETHAARPATQVEVNAALRYRVFLPFVLKRP